MNITRRRADLSSAGSPGAWARRLACALMLCAGPVLAAELSLPTGARETRSIERGPTTYAMPIGPWQEGGAAVLRLEGNLHRSAWRLEGQGLTTFQVLEPLLNQLDEQGYTVLYDCADMVCGGFDFRFNTAVMPAPYMYVDLSDYRYVAAQDASGARHVSLLVSRTPQAGFVQITRMSQDAAALPALSATASPLRAAPVTDLGRRLEADGHVVLSDLTFGVGSADLGPGPFESLRALADVLLANPARRIVLVGHTDGIGGQEGNLALSRRRAASVMARLTGPLGVPANQLTASGVGYLSPVASNLTEAGRLANRRVEAVVLPD